MTNRWSALGTRICVVGTSGSGKTTVAMGLAEALGLTYVCNDAMIWRPHWQPAPDGEVYAEMDAATQGDGWTFDGNLGTSACDQLVLSRCDTLVWLDLPRWQVWSQMLLRTFDRIVNKRPLWHGNVETWRMALSGESIIWWSVKTFPRRHRAYAALTTDSTQPARVVVHLRSRRHVDAWLRSVRSTALAASR